MKISMFHFTVRRMMVAVAFVAIIIGGLLQVARLRRLSEQYEGRVINARRLVAQARFTANFSHDEWLAHCREIDTQNRIYQPFQIARGYPPDLAKKLVAFGELIRLKYERAARYPWLVVEPDPPRPQ
jgi:hypothetical protein